MVYLWRFIYQFLNHGNFKFGSVGLQALCDGRPLSAEILEQIVHAYPPQEIMRQMSETDGDDGQPKDALSQLKVHV